jgi:hypothetical protein
LKGSLLLKSGAAVVAVLEVFTFWVVGVEISFGGVLQEGEVRGTTRGALKTGALQEFAAGCTGTLVDVFVFPPICIVLPQELPPAEEGAEGGGLLGNIFLPQELPPAGGGGLGGNIF